MTYRLSWINHWSEERESDDPRVIIRYTKIDYDQIEHEYHLYFMSENDETAKDDARAYVENHDTIDVFSLYNRETKTVILTEEE